MGKNRIPDGADNGKPSEPEVRELEPLARAQLERMMAVRATILARQEVVAAKRQGLEHRRALLAERERGLEREAADLHAEMDALTEQVVASDQERLQFIMDLGIDPSRFAARLEDGKLIVTEK